MPRKQCPYIHPCAVNFSTISGSAFYHSTKHLDFNQNVVSGTGFDALLVRSQVQADAELMAARSGKASRAIEDVRLVFERNKGSIYAIYNRALRDEPGLQGKVVLKLTIAPSGGVIDLRIVSSELKMPDVEQKLLARIRTFDFGAKDVNEMVVNYPLDFLPS